MFATQQTLEERTNKALKFVGEVRKLAGGCLKDTKLDMLASEDVFFLVDRFLTCFELFRQEGKPIQVNVAYHYTNTNNLTSISQDGLLTDQVVRNGAAFGKGIYTGNNPRAFKMYGDLGFVLLILRGTVRQMIEYSWNLENDKKSVVDDSVDSFQGNKLMEKDPDSTATVFPKSSFYDELILRKSDQVLPLFTFPSPTNEDYHDLFKAQQFLQSLADSFFDERNVKTPVFWDAPTKEDEALEQKLNAKKLKKLAKKSAATPSSVAKLSASSLSVIPSSAKKVLMLRRGGPTVKVFRCKGPSVQDGSMKKPYSMVSKQDPMCRKDCPICHNSMNDGRLPVACLRNCQHVFHEGCLQTAMHFSNKCTVCRCVMANGPGPQGDMEIAVFNCLDCEGFEPSGVILVTYDIPNGIQAPCHENPSVPYKGARRHAYIPNVSKGRDLVRRLAYAFEHGFTFTVGTSLTSGKSNVVVWAGIPHKTRLKGGVAAYGWPDSDFFNDCNAQLDALSIPLPQDLALVVA